MGVVKHQQVVQRGGGCPIPGNTQGQGSEQPGLGANVPAHCKGLDCMTLKVPVKSNYSMVTQS